MDEQAPTNMESEGGPAQSGPDQSLENSSDGQAVGVGPAAPVAGNGAIDPGAPLGRNRDGTPKTSLRGRPRQSVEVPKPVVRQESASAKVQRLSRVRVNDRSEQPPPEESGITDAVPMRIGVDHTSLGQQAALIFITVGSLFFGADFQPDMRPDGGLTQEGRSEFNALRDAFGGYFKGSGVDKIDPMWGLAIALVAYTAKKAQEKPTVKSRIGRCLDWCKARLARGWPFGRNGSVPRETSKPAS